MNIASMQAEQDFLDNYRAEVREYLSSTPGSYAHISSGEILDQMFTEWDDTQGNADALNQIWDEIAMEDLKETISAHTP